MLLSAIAHFWNMNRFPSKSFDNESGKISSFSFNEYRKTTSFQLQYPDLVPYYSFIVASMEILKNVFEMLSFSWWVSFCTITKSYS